MKMHICFLVSSLCNEGPVNVMYNIISNIDFSKFKVSIITFIPEKINSRFNEFEAFPISIYQLAKDKPISALKLFKSLKKIVKEINPDALHAHCPRSLYLMGFLPSKYKRIYTIHNYPGYLQYILYGKLKGQIVIELNHFFTKKCHLPVACSESISIEYKEKKNWEIKAIPNGASLPVWIKNKEEKEKLRAEFGLKDNVKYFIFIGRFSKEKNVDVIVDAFKKLNREDIGLVMLGNGPMWEEQNNRKGENIILPGFTTRVYDYLKATDFYISASEVEGMPNTILENMSVGNPMLLSDIPSHQEILRNFNNRIVGLKIDNHNPIDIIDKINEIVKLDSDEIASVIHKVFEQKYTAQVMSQAYQDAYINLIK